MLRLPPKSQKLTDAERYAVSVLVDGSRLLVVSDEIDAVQLAVCGSDDEEASIEHLRAHRWGISHAPAEVRVTRSLLRAVLDIAGGAAESRAIERDRFDRIPSSANPVVLARSERIPLLAEACVALREATLASAGRVPLRFLSPWPNGHRWAAALSHDLDVVEKWPVFTSLRLAELAGKGEYGRALRVVGAAVTAAPSRPTWTGVRRVLEIERDAGLRSTWVILCGPPTMRTMRAGDLTYHPEGRATRRILRAILSDSHEIGLHGSLDTVNNADLFAAQRARLSRLVERDVRGVRQHYLRMQ